MEDEEEEGFGATITIASECTEAEKEYDKVLDQMREAEGLKMYADVYTKLYDSYYKLKDENVQNKEDINQLKTKLGRFDDTISDYQAELNEAHKNIETLQLSLDEARAMTDAMHARELASVESLETIKKTVAKLEKELTAIKRAGDDDAGAATSAVKEKEKFEKEKARLVSELETVKMRLASMSEYVEELDAKNTAADEKIAQLEEQLEEAGNNAVRTNRLVEHMREESNSLNQEVEHRNNTIKNLRDQIVKLERNAERRDRQMRALTTKMDTAAAERDAATSRASQLMDSLDRLRFDCEQTKQLLTNTTMDVKSYQTENTRMKAELTKCLKTGVQQLKQYQMVERLKSSIEAERDGLRQQVTVMEREIMLEKKQAESDRRDIENLNREKEILNKSMQKIQNEALDNLHMLHLQENRLKQVEHELDQSTAQISKQRLTIRQLEKDKDRMLEEAMALNEKIDEIAEEVRLRNADITDLKKALREEQVNARKCSVALDTCRVDRNMLHKNYTEAMDEIQDLKQKMRMLAYQIEQLKEDISGKETGLKTCEATLSKCNKKVEMLRMEVQGVQVKLGDARADISALRQEEARLNRIIHDGDTARAKLVKDLEGLMNERDVVGAQLVRRNDEISLLYEKIRILEVTLHRGERQYEQRVEDIRLLRLEIIRLRKEKNLLSKGIENMTDLRLEVFNIERELGRERLRVRALEEALETPLNVHRWRKLQGTDPESVQLTHKLRLTQKKVLAQSEMLVLRDRELKETKNLYTAVKDMLALQPSPEIQQTLNRTQHALAQRTTKMKCLIAEVSMREQQVTDLRHELDRANGELSAFKQKYYEMKRALDADEARRLRVPGSPDGCPCPPQHAPGAQASH